MAPLQSQDDLNMAIDIVDRSPHMRSLRVFLSQGGSGHAHSPQHGPPPGRLGQLFDKVSKATWREGLFHLQDKSMVRGEEGGF